MKTYCLELTGPYACFTRPEMKVGRVSYGVMTHTPRRYTAPHRLKGAAPMTEIHFVVEEVPAGGFVARAMGPDIFTEADDLPALHAQVRDAVHCHFEDRRAPSLIRLHITREEVLAA